MARAGRASWSRIPQHVAGLDIAVHQAVRVRGVERRTPTWVTMSQHPRGSGRRCAARPDERLHVPPVDERRIAMNRTPSASPAS